MNAEFVTADDLEPPTKRRRLLVETTSVYEVWVDDDDDLGAVAMVKRLEEDGDSHELFSGLSPIDGGWSWRAPDEWDLYDGSQHGPWQTCPWPDCERPQYPWYGADPTCSKHSVVGCQRRNLPEREFAS